MNLILEPREANEADLNSAGESPAGYGDGAATTLTTGLFAASDSPHGTAPEAKIAGKQSGRGIIVICSETNRRANNEDSHLVTLFTPHPEAPPVCLLSLSDGMGGHEYGEHASREALRRLALFFLEQWVVLPGLNRQEDLPSPEPAALVKSLEDAVPLINAQVQRLAQINGWGKTGATLVVAAVCGDTAVVANIGDSPAYHLSGRDRTACRLTEDHSLAGMLVKANLITAEMARVHEGKSQLEHFIGSPRLPKELPIRIVSLTAGDFLLLCSDGVSNTLPETHLAAELFNNPSDTMDDLMVRCASLVGTARAQGEHDNQTIILYRHGTETFRAPEMVVIPDTGPIRTGETTQEMQALHWSPSEATLERVRNFNTSVVNEHTIMVMPVTADAVETDTTKQAAPEGLEFDLSVGAENLTEDPPRTDEAPPGIEVAAR